VEIWEQENCVSLYVDIKQVYQPDPNKPTSTWEVIVEDQSDITVRAVAATGLHLDYQGPHSFGANTNVPMRVHLAADSPAARVDSATVQFRLASVSGGQKVAIELFDDGQHGDGEAGDGLFGGRVSAPRGIWYLEASGSLLNGGTFARLHDVPLRVRGFSGASSRPGQQLPGNTRQVEFTVSNTPQDGTNQAAMQLYELGFDSSLGWATSENLPPTIALAPGETRVFKALVTIPPDAETGQIEETSLVVMEAGDLAASESLTVDTIVVDELSIYLPNIMRN
jgi:hypothetical protein